MSSLTQAEFQKVKNVHANTRMRKIARKEKGNSIDNRDQESQLQSLTSLIVWALIAQWQVDIMLTILLALDQFQLKYHISECYGTVHIFPFFNFQFNDFPVDRVLSGSK